MSIVLPCHPRGRKHHHFPLVVSPGLSETFPMTQLLPLFLGLLMAAGLGLSGSPAHAAEEAPAIQKLLNDCERLSEEPLKWKAEENLSTVTVEKGIGYQGSKGIRIRIESAGHLLLSPEVTMNYTPLDLHAKGSYQFWIHVVRGPVIMGLEADEVVPVPGDRANRIFMGDDAEVVDFKGKRFGSGAYLIPSTGNKIPPCLHLPDGFQGWIVVPSSISPEGRQTGWQGQGKELLPFESLIFWFGLPNSGEIVVDHFSLAPKKK